MFHAYTCSEILREIHFIPRNESFSQEKQLIIEVKITIPQIRPREIAKVINRGNDGS